jgi:hypothetical protein
MNVFSPEQGIGVHPVGVNVTGVYLIYVHLIGVYLKVSPRLVRGYILARKLLGTQRSFLSKREKQT